MGVREQLHSILYFILLLLQKKKKKDSLSPGTENVLSFLFEFSLFLVTLLLTRRQHTLLMCTGLSLM